MYLMNSIEPWCRLDPSAFSMAAAAKKRIWSWIIRSGFYRRGGVQRRRWTVANASYTKSHYMYISRAVRYLY